MVTGGGCGVSVPQVFRRSMNPRTRGTGGVLTVRSIPVLASSIKTPLGTYQGSQHSTVRGNKSHTELLGQKALLMWGRA